tara:strand:- start:165 stop:1076 length:912 start_codon:yes stop_codon:yes gene_type:complete
VKKTLLIFFLIISFIFLAAYLLDVDIFSILQNEYKQNTPNEIVVINDKRIDIKSFKNDVFFVFDKSCKKYGPFSLEEALAEVNKGFDSYCLNPNLNIKLLEIHKRKESNTNTLKTLTSNFAYSIPGIEGDENSGIRIDIAIFQLPEPLRSIVRDEVEVINGCHPYGEVLFGRCVYGVFDPVGYDADGNYGNEWANSIWISERGINSGNLYDILLHEAAHAYSYLKLQHCLLETGVSFRDVAHKKFGNEEFLADAFVYFFGGNWTNYYVIENLSIEDTNWIRDMVTYCDWYIENKEFLEKTLGR